MFMWAGLTAVMIRTRPHRLPLRHIMKDRDCYMISIGNLKAADISDPGLLSEMEAAMKPEYIILFPDALEVAFPQGTLPSQEYSYVVGFDYDKELKAVLQPWAVPDSRQGVGKIGENGIIGVSELYFRTGFWYNRRKFLHGL